ncbi:PAS domain S-box protein [Alicyclobacillus sp.]|uniref:PAS domain-containing protein n=1 Tax=Alicyclobacillus sp. TaxID=61169 RepID=UPI0025C73BD2|nr:PAS domain S-box protein [Alicyclobacillus sp.]
MSLTDRFGSVEQVLHRVTDGVISLDRDGGIQYVHGFVARWMGGEDAPDGYTGQCLWDLFPRLHHSRFYEACIQAMASGRTMQFAEFFPQTRRWFEIRLFPDANGLTALVSDVTELRRILYEQEQRYQSLFEHNPDGVFSLDRHGRYAEVNPAALRMTGYTKEEMLGRPFAPFVYPDDLPVARACFERAMAGEPQAFDVRVLSKDGRILHLHATNISAASCATSRSAGAPRRRCGSRRNSTRSDSSRPVSPTRSAIR